MCTCTRSQHSRTGAHTPTRAQRCLARSEAHSPGPGPGRSPDLTPSLLPQPPQRCPPLRLGSWEARPTPCDGGGWRPCLLWSLTARAAALGAAALGSHSKQNRPRELHADPDRHPASWFPLSCGARCDLGWTPVKAEQANHRKPASD